MTITHYDLHKLFCPYLSWAEYRVSCLTDEDRKEWLENFLAYCKCSRKEVIRTLKEYAYNSDRERREQRIIKYERAH